MKLLTRMQRSGAIGISFVFLLLAGCGGGGTAAPTGSVSGTVTSMDTNQPVAGLTLELVDKNFTPYTGNDPASYVANKTAVVATAVTGKDGSYQMPNVPAGDYYLGAASPSNQSVLSASGENPVTVSVDKDAVTADLLSGTPVESSQDEGTYAVDVTFENLPESKDGKYNVLFFRRDWTFFIPLFSAQGYQQAFSAFDYSVGNIEFNPYAPYLGFTYVASNDKAFPPLTLSFTAPAEDATNYLYLVGCDNHYYVEITYTTPSGDEKSVSSPLFSVPLHSPPAQTSFVYDGSANKVVEIFPTNFGFDENFAYSSSSGDTGTFALNGDETWNATINGVDYSGTWSTDTGGRLICVTTSGGNFIDSYNVTSLTDNTITTTYAETHPDTHDYVLYTATFTRIFSAAMLAGRSYSYTGKKTGSQGIISFNADGTWTLSGDTTTSGTWSIDDQGRLVCKTSGTATTTTYTLTKNFWNVFETTASALTDQGNPSTDTVTMTEVFSADLMAGKTFRYSESGPSVVPFAGKKTITFENDGTWHTESGLSGSWEVNSDGNLHVTNADINFYSYLKIHQDGAIKALCSFVLNEQHTLFAPGLQDFILDSSQ